MEIKCPRCNQKAKLKDCECKNPKRKRIMIDFPCHHYAFLIYNVPNQTDNNTIMKDFQSISTEYFSKEYYLHNYGDRYIE